MSKNLLIEILGVFLNVMYPFCLCFWGQRVSNDSVNIAKACYDIDFVGTDLSFQKSVKIMIQAAQTPTTFTAGGYADLSLVTFQQVSYKYPAS